MTKMTQSQPSNSSNFLDETKNFLDETKRAQVDRLAPLSISVSRDHEPSEAIPAARRIDDATPAARAHRMDGHLMDPVMDTDHAVHNHDADRFADQPPWH